MQDENRKFSHELGWIVGLGLLGVIAAYLLDPGPCDEPTIVSSLDPIGYFSDLDSSCYAVD